MATIPQIITPLPTPPSTSDPANFDVRADAFLGALPGMVTQINSNNSTSYTNAVEGATSATNANASKVAAETAATNADASKVAAETAATNANASKVAAETANADIQKYYLGRKSTPPTVDNQGNPLQAGAWYTNTNGTWYWWNGSWVPGVGDIAGSYLPLSGGTTTGPISVPAGASGNQVPRASEVTSKTASVFDHTVTMNAAPLNQWCAYSSGTGVGSDWPPGHPTVNVWDVITFGFGDASTARYTQIASQSLNVGYQGWTWLRNKHDGAWSQWTRVITDTTVISKQVTVNQPAGSPTYSLDPALGGVHAVSINATCQFILPAPRQLGDEVTLHATSVGAIRAITFSANVRLPVDGTGALLPFPQYPANGMISLVFTSSRPNIWDCYYAGVH